MRESGIDDLPAQQQARVMHAVSARPRLRPPSARAVSPPYLTPIFRRDEAFPPHRLTDASTDTD